MLTDVSDSQLTLTRLKEVKEKRLAESIGSPQRMEDTCKLIPESLLEHHGFHRVCYQRFTMNLDRLTQPSSMSEASSSKRPSRGSLGGDKVIFKPDCIFCSSESRKKVKIKGTWTTEGLSTFECDGWINILELAERKEDENLLRRIRGHDLFACEAKYHRSCRTKYIQRPEKWRSTDSEQCQRQAELEYAHRCAFQSVCQVVDNAIIQAKGMMRLTDLRQTYVSALDQTAYPNPDYRSENLKMKLMKHAGYQNQLSFCDMQCSKTNIVYSSSIDVDTAVKLAFKLGSSDVIENTGLEVRQTILQTHEDAPDIRWPPLPQTLGNMDDDGIPDNLVGLLRLITTGKSSYGTPRSERLIHSIGQDICRAATNGSWKLPKHILLCMTLRHLYRSEKLITLLNRMGHCESYSFSLELETAIAEAIEETSTLLSSQIIRQPEAPAVFHSEFDNFDQLLNDLTGMGSIHTAHGIMLQDIQGDPSDCGGQRPDIPSVEKNKQRSFKLNRIDNLPDCYVTKRNSPTLKVEQLTYPGATDAWERSSKLYIIWVLARMFHQEQQAVPGWAGFMSLTGKLPNNLTTIDYYPVIPHPITEYKTVQECLKYAEDATHEVGQEYVINTFDLGVCMKAFPLIWNNPARYEKHIILIGTFHLQCAFMKMLGKKMNGSGLSDIFLEAGMLASGSLNGVLSGKHYDRAIHCHVVMLECLERLLLEQYAEARGDTRVFFLPDDSEKRCKK